MRDCERVGIDVVIDLVSLCGVQEKSLDVPPRKAVPALDDGVFLANVVEREYGMLKNGYLELAVGSLVDVASQ